MAERKLNLEAPLLSTRRIQKTTAVSVRRNKTYDFTHDNSKPNDHSSSSVPVLVDHFTDSASVPFTWEQAPGRLKRNDSTSTPQQVFTPCLPPGKVIDGISPKGKQVDEEESEDVFSDARDTLSPKDSFSVNHSISGVSGYGVVVEKKKTLNPQSRDFMLNRFLPAAKAMTMEQSHYALNRKPSSFMSEPTLQIRDLVPVEKRQSSKRYDESIVLPCYDHQDIDDDVESKDDDDDDDDDEVSEYAYLPRKGCGMLPQLCFKESLGMLNTVPGFKTKHKSSVTSPSHDQVKSSKVSQLKSRFQSVKQLALDSVSKHKLSDKVESPVHASLGKKFNSESNLTCSASRSLSPYRHPRCMSPFRTAKETESMRANRLNKHIRNISLSQELLCSKDNSSTSSLLEQTVYVNTEEAEKKEDTNLELEELENISSGKDRSPLAPPSPKKPSESWLLHNLPSVTSQIPSRRYPKENSRNVSKWETIVKTSYMHRNHVRYSEELVAHTSLQ